MAKYLPAKILRILPLAVTGLFCVMATDARAQFTFASDNADNYGGTWNNGSDQGSGFGGWGLSAGVNSGGFIGNPATDGMGTTGLGTTAFGTYSTGSGYFNASRGFDVGMGIGDSFTFYWAINFDAGAGSKGFDLRSDGTTIFNVNNTGSSTITTTGGGSLTGYGTTPMLVTLTRTGTSAYSFSMTSRSGGATFSTNISSSSTINNFNFYIGNQNDSAGQKNMFFDTFSITNSGVFSSGGTVTNANTFAGSGALSIGASTTLILSGGGNNNYSGATTISNGSTLIFAGSGTSQFASTIGGGTGNVVMSNSSGLVVLNNNNTYTGNTTVAAGRLLIGNASALGSTGTLTVGTGGQLQLSNGITMSRGITLSGDGVGSTGALLNVNGSNIWSGDITNASGTRINAESGTTLTIGGNIVNSGGGQNFYVGGAGNVTINGTLDGTATTGNGALYKDGSGVLTLTNNNSGLTGLVRLLGGTISITNNNSLGSGVLELGGLGTQAILSVGTNTTRSQNLLIQNSSTNSVVNVASGSAFTVTGSLTQDGTPANTTKFGKDGSGTLVLAGASGNTYNGQIQIGNGTVIAGTSTALGTNVSTSARGIDLGLNVSDASQANNVALRASNGVTVGQSIYVAPNTGNTLRTIGLAGSGSATFNNEIYLDGTLTVDAGAAGSDLVTISGAINNTGGLTKTGAGVLLLSGNNGYTGATTISAGTLRIGADNRISSQSAINIASGATLDMNGFSDTLGALSGSGNVTLGAGALTTSVGADSTYSGVISGTGRFVKAGTAVLTLDGVSSYTGNTEIDAGTLAIGSTGGLSGSSMLYVGSGLNGSDATLSVAGTTTLANAIQVNTNNGTSGTRTIIKSDATSQTLSGNFTNNIQTSVNVANSAGNLAISGAMAGAGNIVKSGSGTLALSGSSGSFSGGLYVDQGTLHLAGGSTGASAIEIGGGATVNAINASNAALRVSANSTFSQALTINANTNASGQSGTRAIDFANSGGTATLSGALSHEKAFTVNVANAGATGILSGLISSNTTGGTTITVSGNGILGVNNTGNTTDARWSVSSGSTLAIGDSRNLGADPGGYYSDKVTLNGGTLQATNSFGLNANVGIQLGASTTSTISVGSGLVMTNPAVMGGSGNLTKSGSGTLVLSGNNTYTGSTTVSQGELRMMGVLSSSSLLNVSAGATLSGTGTIGGATTISGIHSPGTSPGIQTFSSGLTYNAGSTNVWELTSNTNSLAARGISYDGINLGTGANLTFAGTTKMSLVFNSAGSSVSWSDTFWNSDKTWLVYDLSGAGAITGTNNFSINSIDWVDSQGNLFTQSRREASFSISVSGQDLNLIYTIPEPSTYALLTLSALGLAGHVIRRRRR